MNNVDRRNAPKGFRSISTPKPSASEDSRVVVMPRRASGLFQPKRLINPKLLEKKRS